MAGDDDHGPTHASASSAHQGQRHYSGRGRGQPLPPDELHLLSVLTNSLIDCAIVVDDRRLELEAAQQLLADAIRECDAVAGRLRDLLARGEGR